LHAPLVLKFLNYLILLDIQSPYWLKISEPIEYKFLSLTYKVLTTTLFCAMSAFLLHLFLLVTFSQPPTLSARSLQVTVIFHFVSGINSLILFVIFIHIFRPTSLTSCTRYRSTFSVDSPHSCTPLGPMVHS